MAADEPRPLLQNSLHNMFWACSFHVLNNFLSFNFEHSNGFFSKSILNFFSAQFMKVNKWNTFDGLPLVNTYIANFVSLAWKLDNQLPYLLVVNIAANEQGCPIRKGWSPKFATGLNIIISTVQKVWEWPSYPFAKIIPLRVHHFGKRTVW